MGLGPRGVDVLLDTEAHPLQILAQPVVAEAHAGVRVGLGLPRTQQRLDGLQLVDDAGECLAFPSASARARCNGIMAARIPASRIEVCRNALGPV